MPRYHFNLHDGLGIMDEEGHELPDLHEARQQGIRFVSQALSDAGEQVFEDIDWRLEVTDERGLILFAIQVSTQDAAANYQPARDSRGNGRLRLG